MESDLILVRQKLMKGDNSYLHSLYVDKKDYCVAFLIKHRQVSKLDAEDIFVESLVVLREKILNQTLVEVNNMNSFLVGVCNNLGKEMIFKKVRTKTKYEEIKRYVESQNYSIEEDDGSNNEELMAICDQALEAITEKCRRLLMMFHFDGLTMAEIAEIEGFASPNVAKTMKSRCFQKWTKIAHNIRNNKKQ